VKSSCVKTTSLFRFKQTASLHDDITFVEKKLRNRSGRWRHCLWCRYPPWRLDLFW